MSKVSARYDGKESDLQAACVKWFKTQYPKHIIYAITNEGIAGAAAQRMAYGAKRKRMGVMAGIPDLCIPCVAFRFTPESEDDKPSIDNMTFTGALYIELKVKGGSVSKIQKDTQTKLRNAGNDVHVCYNLEEFQAVVNGYL